VIHRFAALLLALPLAACSPVATVGKRIDTGADIHIDRLQVYSLVPMHTMGIERLHRDAVALDTVLDNQLKKAKIDTVVEDVQSLVTRHGLPVEVSVMEVNGTRRISGALPERDLLRANAGIEAEGKASHRLVLYPLRLNVNGSSGVANGIIRWQLEGIEGARPLAVGLLRYTADARGFPAQAMAADLVAKLQSLGIRAAGQ
jgi:hypothetical protein